jgi:hypothetical protein
VYRNVDRDGQLAIDYEEACTGFVMLLEAFTKVTSLSLHHLFVILAITNPQQWTLSLKLGASSLAYIEYVTNSSSISYHSFTRRIHGRVCSILIARLGLSISVSYINNQAR